MNNFRVLEQTKKGYVPCDPKHFFVRGDGFLFMILEDKTIIEAPDTFIKHKRTDLKDTAGLFIYEDDILLDTNNEKWHVFWNKRTARFSYKGLKCGSICNFPRFINTSKHYTIIKSKV